MGKQKARTTSNETSTQQNTYGYMTPPPSPYYETAKGLIDQYDGGAADIVAGYGRAANEIRNGGNEFLGAYTTPEVRQKQMDNRLFRNEIDKGRDLAQAGRDANAYKASGYMSLGGATAPQLVQTGGTNTSSGTRYNEQWGSGLYSPLGQFGLQAAGGALMGA